MKYGILMTGVVVFTTTISGGVMAQESATKTVAAPYPPLVTSVSPAANPNLQAMQRAGIKPGIASGASGFPARPDGVRSSNAALWATAGAIGLTAAVAAGVAALLSAGSSSDASSSSVTTTTSTE
ncbi:MAG: hypothetical protein HN725_20210 [Alphaproteobacteria bacterium]|jgi:hypothetical protein|nr:hypothetical protein [Alphaproteobacteria bacterium]MBT4083133.1 hypothetical protein [Alphaproteobacteria bacterium]MBT4544578.1 hypothetical protein [Alphaproteobacteria bacterium]MBT7747622.1 hypothetical protein [Alphaproteobacteria bacterium]